MVRAVVWLGGVLAILPAAGQTEKIVRVDLSYQAPGHGPAPNFSPYGTQVKLIDLPSDAKLPEGASRPARAGAVQVGPDRSAWVPILATVDADHPQDVCRLYVDRNRNGDFKDDGLALTAKLSVNDKTKALWATFSGVEMSIPYGGGVVEPYMVDFWAVRESAASTPDVLRYSVRSWRSGRVSVDGVEALVAVMDSNNDAMFSAKDQWSVLAASEKDAAARVLSHQEARAASRLMFLDVGGGKERVLEFRSVAPDGRSLTFAVVDRSITKAQDRAPDDTLGAERSRPRTAQPFVWADGGFDKALAKAKESGRKLIVDFWTSWCGPCKSLDEWIWTDAEVAGVLNAGYVGIKLDGDLEKELVTRFRVQGYPTILVLDASGKETQRMNYLASKPMAEALRK